LIERDGIVGSLGTRLKDRLKELWRTVWEKGEGAIENRTRQSGINFIKLQMPNNVMPNGISPNDIVPNDAMPNDIMPKDTTPTDVMPNDFMPTDIAPNPLMSNDKWLTRLPQMTLCQMS